MHPDFTPTNVIRDETGQLVLVDNELMTTGGLPMIDLCNTVNAMDQKHASLYLEYYSKLRGELNWRYRNNESLQALWVARKVGSFFITGDLYLAAEWLQRYAKGENLLPQAFI